MRPTICRRAAALAVAAAVIVALAASPALGVDQQRGPDPTRTSIEAATGPFATTKITVADSQTVGFGAATIYYPTTTTVGTFGGVAIVPGYTATQSSLAWLAARISSFGFVVIAFDTTSRYDQPKARGAQLLAALDHLTTVSTVRDRVDPTRLAVIGHSMGGGGALEAAKLRPWLQAAVPLTPWSFDKTWPEVATPTLLIGAERDSIAPVRTHAEPFFTSLPTSLDAAYLELNEASHFAPNSPNTTIARFTIAWLKRFVDDDLRYDQFLCPPSTASSAIEEHRDRCPHG